MGRRLYHANTGPQSAVVGRAEVVRSRPDLADVWDRAAACFPVRVTRSFWRRAQRSEALAAQILPDARELEVVDGDHLDPVGDLACSPVPWVVHKYPSRVLLLLTKRCHLYCRYCFRRNVTMSERTDPSPSEWEAALAYARDCGATEAILSGGDPLAVRDSRLFEAIDALSEAIPVLRIHTRAPITKPDRVTRALVEGLSSRQPVWVVVHANHPDELSPEVDEALARMVDAGIPVLNQSVLLRGVNDDPTVLAELFEGLVRRRVFPYYLHHTDRAAGAAHFAVGIEEGLGIYRALRDRVSGIALPRYVIDPPDGSGKVDVAVFHAGTGTRRVRWRR